MEIDLPFDFVVEGVPPSLSASPKTKARWKLKVVAAIRKRLEGWEWLVTGPVAVTICHFPADSATGDVDNIVKVILDAMTKVVFVDDSQVERVLVRKIDPRSVVSFQSPGAELVAAMQGEKPLVYVKVMQVPSEEAF